jgi:hypothetical protein
LSSVLWSCFNDQNKIGVVKSSGFYFLPEGFVDEEDLPAVRNWVNNPKIVDYLSEILFLPHTYNNSENFLNAILDEKSQGNDFVIADLQTNLYNENMLMGN